MENMPEIIEITISQTVKVSATYCIEDMEDPKDWDLFITNLIHDQEKARVKLVDGIQGEKAEDFLQPDKKVRIQLHGEWGIDYKSAAKKQLEIYQALYPENEDSKKFWEKTEGPMGTKLL